MDIDKSVLKFTQRGKIPRPGNTAMKNNVRELPLPEFEAYHIDTDIKMLSD